jgi:hypothetical protein
LLVSFFRFFELFYLARIPLYCRNVLTGLFICPCTLQTTFRCSVLVALFQCPLAFSSVSLFPKRECKIIAKTARVQVFSQYFFIFVGFIRLSY